MSYAVLPAAHNNPKKLFTGVPAPWPDCHFNGYAILHIASSMQLRKSISMTLHHYGPVRFRAGSYLHWLDTCAVSSHVHLKRYLWKLHHCPAWLLPSGQTQLVLLQTGTVLLRDSQSGAESVDSLGCPPGQAVNITALCSTSGSDASTHTPHVQYQPVKGKLVQKRHACFVGMCHCKICVPVKQSFCSSAVEQP